MTTRGRRELGWFVAAVAAFSVLALILLHVTESSGVTTDKTRVLGERHRHQTPAPVPHVFAPTSFWYQPLPRVVPANAQSSLYVQNIQDQITRHYGNAYVSTVSYSTPVYKVPAHQPMRTVRLWNCLNKANFPNGKLTQQAAAQIHRMPIPVNAVPAAGTDGAIAVWQPSTDTYWETWKTRKTSSGWQACWGGRIEHASSSDGAFPDPFGSTATGISLLGGVIRIKEFQRGYIDHAINLALPETRTNVFSWPATHTDGRTDSASAIPEGLRFRLDPTLDLSKYNLTPVARIIAVAAQKYGFVVRDKAGAVSVYGEDPTPLMRAGQPNPYDTFFHGKRPYQILDNFPWDHLIALPMDYGKPAG